MACLQQGTKECQQQLCCSGISVRTGPPVEGPRRHIAELIASAGGLGNAEGVKHCVAASSMAFTFFPLQHAQGNFCH